MRNHLLLSSNALKIIAAISMTVDHVGLLFFPQYEIFRIIGRIALPIFSFMIAEGCRHTRNKLRYFLTIFVIGLICQIAYGLYSDDLYMNILITFSFSILLIYSLQHFKTALFDVNATPTLKMLSAVVFVFSVAAVYCFNLLVAVDYGFFGCMLPVFASAFHLPKNCDREELVKIDTNKVSVLLLSLGMLFLTLDSGIGQAWCLLSLPFLFLYSGHRGKYRMKYFFYVYYPVHLLLLEFINLLI